MTEESKNNKSFSFDFIPFHGTFFDIVDLGDQSSVCELGIAAGKLKATNLTNFSNTPVQLERAGQEPNSSTFG